MLQTQPNSSDACISGVPKTEKQADIVKKLEDLNKWQEEQKKLLNLRQTIQRQQLGVEQKTAYETLGLQQVESDTTIMQEEQNDNKIDFVCQQNKHLNEYVEDGAEESVETNEDCINKDNDSYTTLIGRWDSENLKSESQMINKRPFLKRGEGLKQRFKIDPDEFRLKNLPKYKYANAHPNLRLKPLNKSNKTADLKTKQVSFITPKAKALDNVANLDAQEQQFQNLFAKVVCSSTPETKAASLVVNKHATSIETNPINRREKKNVQKQDEKLNDSRYKTAITQVIAWNKILNPLEVEPLQVPRNGKQTMPQTEESIFELLEQKAQEGSFDMDSTCLKEFMARTTTEKLNESDDIIPVKGKLKNQRFQPVDSAETLLQNNSYCSSDEMESTSSDDVTHKTVETSSTLNQHMPQVKVRFSDSNETHEYEQDLESSVENSSRLLGGTCQLAPDLGDTSKTDLFLQFKHALFAALQDKANQCLANNDSTFNSISDTTLTDKNVSNSPACKELQEKTEMIKLRLVELEKEIKFFKENNRLLLKAKQEHELQISIKAQENLEAVESLKDEKIRMEIYLHDERLKLEDEKRQFEQNVKMKTQGIIARERKECERLKDYVNQLEIQLKTKENNHTAAQSRLRTQMRNLEKEQSKLYEQIENLNRENRRLEAENVKISREQNNKILLEINRNIAKLAPKQIQHTSFPIPNEGHPTLGSSINVSKSVDAAVTAKIKCAKPQKAIAKISNVRLQQPNHKQSTSAKDQDTEIAVETNFVEEHKQKQLDNMSLDDEDDLLKEFQLTPEKVNTTPPTKRKVTNNNSPPKPLPRGQNQVPEPPPSSPRSRCAQNMKREIVNADGSKDIWYPNGNLKKISTDGMIIRILYYNKDIKETNINEGTVKYYYAETNTWHTSYLDGLEILEFPNGQVEHRHKNGRVEVHYPNNSVKIINPSDQHKQEEWRFPDGTHLAKMHNGDKILSLPNGQKEIHNKLHKRREYPDGTVKIVYPDSSTETRYSNGRVRLKDKEGKLVMDTDMAK